MTGVTSTIDSRKLWIVKINSEGIIEWNKTYGSIGSGNFIQRTTDGSYIIIGDTGAYFQDTEFFWLIKVKPNGEILWDKTFRRSGRDLGFSLQETADSGFILAGRTVDRDRNRFSIWLIKTDSEGDVEWDRTFRGPKWDSEPATIQQTSDGGYIVTGYAYVGPIGEGGSNVWLIKIDTNGNELWNRTFGGNENDYGKDIQITKDGGFIIAGNTQSFADDYWGDIWLIRADYSGQELWNRTFGISWGNANSVREVSDGGFILAGDSMTETGKRWIIIKTDASGKKEWWKIY
jgi:hypothetical protein